MFCRKCGFEIEDGEKCCPKCGTEIKVGQPAPPSPSFSSPQLNRMSNRMVDIAVAAVACLLALFDFLPLFKINIPFISGSYTAIDLFNLAMKLTQAAGSGSSATGGLGLIYLWVALFTVLWLGCIAVAIVEIVLLVKKKQCSQALLFVFAAQGLVCVATSLLVEQELKGYAGSYSMYVSGMLTCTGWVWAIIVISIAAFVVCRMMRKSCSK